MDRGTGAGVRSLGLGGALAGKTGTTNDTRDAWFAGYSPRLVAVVWVGFDDGAPLELSGARGALPIWTDFMRAAAPSRSRGSSPCRRPWPSADRCGSPVRRPSCPRPNPTCPVDP